MKMFHVAAAAAIGIASASSAVSAYKFGPGMHEQRFLKSVGLQGSSRVVYANSKGQRVAFLQFKQELDKTGRLEIARQGMNDEVIAMKVAPPPSADHS